MKPQSGFKVGLRILVAAALIFLCTRTFVDPDLWWHLRCGIDILNSGHVVVAEPYSFLSFFQKWINHEWLSEIFFAFAFTHFGFAGLVALKSIIVLLTLGLILKLLASWQADDLFIAICLITVAIIFSAYTSVVRPHVFSCLFLTLLFTVLHSAKKRPALIFFLPGLFALWVNFHGGFFVGLCTFFLWTFLETIFKLRKGLQKEVSFAWIALVLSVLALGLNPYGYELPEFILKVSFMPRPEVSEWKPIELLTSYGLCWALSVAATIFSLAKSRKPIDPTSVIIWLAFACAPLISVRHVLFFGIATIFLVGEHLLSAWQERTVKTEKAATTGWRTDDLRFVASCAIVSAWIVYLSFPHFAPSPVVMSIDPPQVPIGIIKRIGARGNLLTNFDWGGYAIWHLAPGVKVSSDGRNEFVYSPAVTQAHYLFFRGLGEWNYLLKHFKIDIVMVSTGSPACNLMKTEPGWKEAFEDESSALFFPVDSVYGKQTQDLLKESGGNASLRAPLF